MDKLTKRINIPVTLQLSETQLIRRRVVEELVVAFK